ncbi:MAG: response regulator transcription factor [Clostridia bacterium]|nr:response regulator transcription factor [Clostridia bacterium]
MIRIALCDDNHIFLEEFQDFVEKYLVNHCVKGEVHIYDSGGELIKQLEKDNDFFDIIFLDINMPHVDGIEAAEQVRAINTNVILIFLTSIEDRVYETFQFNTFRFIRKNCMLIELDECLDKALRIVENEKTSYSFKTKEGMVKLSAQEILYFIYINRHVEVKTINNYYILTVTRFQDVINLFSNKDFICIHRGCIVNVKYIKVINRLCIVLDNNEKLSISRYKVNEVFRAFTNYAR